MTTEVDDKAYDPTTPEELLALSKHMAGDPSLAPIFQRVGLHEPFDRKSGEYRRVIASRDAFKPSLYDRPCGNQNTFLAEALARRIYSKTIRSDEEAIRYLSDRIRRCTYESASTLPLESEIKDIMRNMDNSEFFDQFKKYRQNKNEIIEKEIDPYGDFEPFICDQKWMYGLCGRGFKIDLVVLRLLNIYWFDHVQDLSPATVDYLLENPRNRIFLREESSLRKG